MSKKTDKSRISEYNAQKNKFKQEIRERNIKRSKEADIVLSNHKTGKGFLVSSLQKIYETSNNLYDPALLSNSNIFCAYKYLFNKKESKDLVFDILSTCIERNCDFFRGDIKSLFYRVVEGIVSNKNEIIRPISEWGPKSHNSYAQISSILRHLFCMYNVPLFFDSAFCGEIIRPIEQEWFIHVGKGGSVRTLKNLPIVMTKKMAHYMMMAPKNFSVTEAIYYGQIMNMGGNDSIVNKILSTSIVNDFSHNEFWISVIKWFIDNPMLDSHQYGPLVDFIRNQKFVNAIPSKENPNILVPVQPNFSMKNRSVEKTIEEMEVWHKSLVKEDRFSVDKWEPCKIDDFSYEEGKDENKKIYTIEQIVNLKELKKEGLVMRNCVYSYAKSCISGISAIFSMKSHCVEKFISTNNMMTIEVDPKRREIVQAREKNNTFPTGKALEILRRFQFESSLSLSKWCLMRN